MSEQNLLDTKVVQFPDADRQRYRDVGLWGTKTISQEFTATASRFPGRTAITVGEQSLTYAELDQQSTVLAAGLNALGLRPGETVLLQVNNTLHSVVSWYGLLKAGLVPICTLAAHRRHEISAIAQQTQPALHLVDAQNPNFDLVTFALEMQSTLPSIRHVLTIEGSNSPVPDVDSLSSVIDVDEARELVAAIQAGIDPDSVAVLQLSGGTTGVPKVIPRLHAEYWYNARAYADRLGWDDDARVGYFGPVSHNAGIVCGVHGPHTVGAEAILGPPALSHIIPMMVEHEVTDTVLGQFAYAIAVDPDLAHAKHLRRVIFSGKKVPREHFDALTNLNIWAGQLFGMGEGLCTTTRLGDSPAVRLVSVGSPLSEYDEIRILQPDSEEEVPAGEVGELCARGPYTIRGYFDAAERNKQAFTGDGFYRSGDLASLQIIDGQPNVVLEGRIKDLINRGGEKINAEEVESLLTSHPAIDEAALVAMPDDRLGERACAFVHSAAGQRPTIHDIRDYLDSLGVAKYKWPERIEWVDDMPRASQLGKLDKKRLRVIAQDLSPEPVPKSAPVSNTRHN
jgi:2,3-dihydroxybenzoate-AMP ligase